LYKINSRLYNWYLQNQNVTVSYLIHEKMETFSWKYITCYHNKHTTTTQLSFQHFPIMNSPVHPFIDPGGLFCQLEKVTRLSKLIVCSIYSLYQKMKSIPTLLLSRSMPSKRITKSLVTPVCRFCFQCKHSKVSVSQSQSYIAVKISLTNVQVRDNNHDMPLNGH